MRGRTAQRGKDPCSYRSRFYRERADSRELVSVRVKLRETDLHILAETDVSRPAGDLVAACRLQLERYIDGHPSFLSSLKPLPDDPLAPPIIRRMLAAGAAAGVGPMAAVAGAVAEYVGGGLLEAGHKEIIIENGGDIFLKRSRPCTVAVFSGRSPLSNRIGIRLTPDIVPMGICTSSGTVGHSLSFGQADSVTVLAGSTALADAAATRLGNEAGCAKVPTESVNRVLEAAVHLTGIRGVVAICADAMGAVGEIELVPLS